jgi:transketolase
LKTSEQPSDGSAWTDLDRHAVDTDHTSWAIVSDGGLEEGNSAEASSLAGHQKPGNPVFLYDDNHIPIEGDTATAFSEDVLGRYEAYGWHTQRIEPAETGDVDVYALYAVLTSARTEAGRPSNIAMRTAIAWPAPHAWNKLPEDWEDALPVSAEGPALATLHP